MSLRRLPHHELKLHQGLATNLAPDSIAGLYTVQADNFDGFDKFRAVGKIPGSSKINSSATDSIKSIHFYEYFSLDRQNLSAMIIATDDGAGSTLLQDVAISTGTVTSLGAIGTAEALTAAKMNERLHFSSPNQGVDPFPTGGFKYDGNRISGWGLGTPGFIETQTIESYDTVGDFSVSAGAATLSQETSNIKEGTGAVKLTKTAGVSDVVFGKTYTSKDIDESGTGLMRQWLYIGPGAFQVLLNAATSADATFQFNFLDGGGGDARFDFFMSDLAQGWNILAMDLSAPDASASDLDPADVDNLNISVRWLDTSVTFDEIVFDHLQGLQRAGPITAAPSGESAAQNTAGTFLVPGTYRYRMSYVTDYGLESNVGSVSATATTAIGQATATLTCTGQPSGGDTFTVNSQVYTWVNSLVSADDVLIGGDLATSLSNLEDAILDTSANEGTTYGTGTAVNTGVTAVAAATTLVCTAIPIGSLGNVVQVSENQSNATLAETGGFLEGGNDGGVISIASFPTQPSDTQIIAWRLYRDKDADGTYRFVVERPLTDTTYTDTTAQTDLSLTTPPIAGDTDEDHSPPVAFSACTTFENRVFGIDADDRRTLHVSNLNQPEQFPLLSQLVFSEEMTAIAEHAQGLIIYTTDRAFLLNGSGTTSDPFVAELTGGELGCNGFRSVVPLRGEHFVMREKEVHLLRASSTIRVPWFMSGPIQDQLNDDLTEASLGDLFAVHDRSRFRVVFFGVGSSGDHDEIFVFQYGAAAFEQITGDGAGTSPQDLRIGSWWRIQIPATVTPLCAVQGESTTDQPELWVGTDEGYVYHFQDTAQLDWANAASTEPVSAIIEAASVPLGSGPAGRGEPRYLQVNMECAAESVWTFDVSLLSDADGDPVASVQFTDTFAAGNKSAVIPIPNVGRAEWCKVKATNAVTGDDGIIRSMRLYFIPRGSFRGQRDS